MGFWSTLGTIGAGIAAPFTGGLSLAAIPAINGLSNAAENAGQTATALENGRANGRGIEAGINQGWNQQQLLAAQILNNALNNQQTQNRANQQFSLQAPGAEMSNSVRGDTLANLQDVGINGPTIGTNGRVPQITGGLRPSLLSANSRQLGQNVSRQMLMRNMSGADTLPNMPAPQMPKLTPPPSATGLDSTLNGIGLVGGLAGAAAPTISDFVNKYGRGSGGSQPGAIPPIGNPSLPSFGGWDDPHAMQQNPDDWMTTGIG